MTDFKIIYPFFLQTNERVKQKLRSLNPRYECYEWYAYLRELLAHKIQLASAKVDDADPLVPTTFSLSYNTFNRRLANYIRIERDNALLLKKIQQIFARKVSFDDFIILFCNFLR